MGCWCAAIGFVLTTRKAHMPEDLHPASVKVSGNNTCFQLLNMNCTAVHADQTLVRKGVCCVSEGQQLVT